MTNLQKALVIRAACELEFDGDPVIATQVKTVAMLMNNFILATYPDCVYDDLDKAAQEFIKPKNLWRLE